MINCEDLYNLFQAGMGCYILPVLLWVVAVLLCPTTPPTIVENLSPLLMVTCLATPECCVLAQGRVVGGKGAT